MRIMKKLPLLLIMALSLRLGVAHGADVSYEEALQSGTDDLQALNFVEARSNLEAALALAKTDIQKAVPHELIGLSYLAEGKYSQSRVEFGKVLEFNDLGLKFAAQLHIGDSYAGEKNFTQARVEYSKVLESKEADYTNKFQAYFSIGQSYHEEKKYPQSRIEFSKLLQFKNEMPYAEAMAQMYVGQSYFFEENFAQARVELLKVLEIEDDKLAFEDKQVIRSSKASSQFIIGASYLKEQNLARAKDEFNKLLEMEKLNPILKVQAEKQLKLIDELDNKAQEKK